MSRELFDKTTPVMPPRVKRQINPNAHHIGVEYEGVPPYMVASQENTFIPVGIAIIMVALVK